MERRCLCGISKQTEVTRRDGLGNPIGNLWSVDSKSP